MGLNKINCEKKDGIYATRTKRATGGCGASDFDIKGAEGLGAPVLLLCAGGVVGYAFCDATHYGTQQQRGVEKAAYIHTENESRPTELGQIVPGTFYHLDGTETDIYELSIKGNTSLKPGDVVFMQHIGPEHQDPEVSPPIACELGIKWDDNYFDLEKCTGGEPLDIVKDHWPYMVEVHPAEKLALINEE